MSRSGASLPPLIPPFRLCMVEEGLYRGAHPSLKNLRFMRRLKLRTILSLVSEPTGPSRDLREYCDAERIRLVWHHVDKYDDGFSHTPALVAALLAEIVDPRNHPLFLHCRDGSHNTGLVIMCLRRLQNWTLPSIYDEFVRYTKSNDISYMEKQFVETFHAKVTIPETIPHWLWEGVRHERHPTIPLQLDAEPGTSSSSLPSVRNLERRHVEPNGGIMPPGVESRCQRPGPSHGSGHENVRAHYETALAALDLCGVQFEASCRQDIGGRVVRGRRSECSGRARRGPVGAGDKPEARNSNRDGDGLAFCSDSGREETATDGDGTRGLASLDLAAVQAHRAEMLSSERGDRPNGRDSGTRSTGEPPPDSGSRLAS